jgi:hypothetical protein
MTSLEKKIDKITRDAGIELTRTTISKISDVAVNTIIKAFEAGVDYGNGGNSSVDINQWMNEQKLR